MKKNVFDCYPCSAKDIHDLKILKTKEEAMSLTKVNHVHKPLRSHEVTPTILPPPEPVSTKNHIVQGDFKSISN